MCVAEEAAAAGSVRGGGWAKRVCLGASLRRTEFVTEVRRKITEARTGVLAERKALEEATEHRNLMAWNQAENRRLHELR